MSGSAQGRQAAGAASPLQTATRSLPCSPDCRLRVEGLEERGGKAREKNLGARRILPCLLSPRARFRIYSQPAPNSPISGWLHKLCPVPGRAATCLRSRPPTRALSIRANPSGLCCPSWRVPLPGPRRAAGAPQQTSWRPPDEAPGPGSHTSPGPAHSRLSGSQRLQPRVPPPQAPVPTPPETCRPGGARRRARCRAFSSERPCRQPGHPTRLPHTGDTRLAADGPPGPSAPLDAPSAAGHARQDPAQRTPAGAPGRRSSLAPSAAGRRPAPGDPPSLPASGPRAAARAPGEYRRHRRARTDRAPAASPREPRAPSLAAPAGSQLPPAPSAAPRAAARPPQSLAGTCTLLFRLPFRPSRNATTLNKCVFGDRHEKDEGATTIRAPKHRNANWPRATRLGAGAHVTSRRGDSRGSAESGALLQRRADKPL